MHTHLACSCPVRGTGYETRCPLKAQWLEWRAVTTASSASEERKSAKSSTGVRAKAVACTAAGANSVRRAVCRGILRTLSGITLVRFQHPSCIVHVPSFVSPATSHPIPASSTERLHYVNPVLLLHSTSPPVSFESLSACTTSIDPASSIAACRHRESRSLA